jgi:hypothetical protein
MLGIATVRNATTARIRRALGALAAGSVVVLTIPVTSGATALPTRNTGLPNSTGCFNAKVLSTLIADDAPNVTFPAHECYNLAAGASLSISDTTGLTINGNGDTLNQPNLGAKLQVDPILELDENKDLSISDLDLAGAYSGTDGGAAYEGSAGVRISGSHGVTMSDVNISNVQGDFVELGADLFTGVLDSRISYSDSSFLGAGFDGLTDDGTDGCGVPGAGATFDDDTFTDMGTNAIDFEYDDYVSGDDTSGCGGNGKPTYAAEDDVAIENNTFDDWGAADWFSSIQPQSANCVETDGSCGDSIYDGTDGVREQDDLFLDNTINAPHPLVQMFGAAGDGSRSGPPAATSFYQMSNITFEGNVGLTPAGSTSGGAPNIPNVGSAMTFQNGYNVTIENNTLPMFYETQYGPYLAAVELTQMTDTSITRNTFDGACSIKNPSSSGNISVSVSGGLQVPCVSVSAPVPNKTATPPTPNAGQVTQTQSVPVQPADLTADGIPGARGGEGGNSDRNSSTVVASYRESQAVATGLPLPDSRETALALIALSALAGAIALFTRRKRRVAVVAPSAIDMLGRSRPTR